MTIVEALALIEAAGGKVQLRGEKVLFRCPDGKRGKELSSVIVFLRKHKAEAASWLRWQRSIDTRIAELVRRRSEDPKPTERVSLARAAEILGATVVLPGGSPTGWPPDEWANRKPLPSGKELIVRCSLCGESATNPSDGVAWIDTHSCAGLRVCSHCGGRGKSCGCALCKFEECCTVCKGRGKVDRKPPPPADDLLTKLGKRTDEELLAEAALLSRYEPEDHRELDKWLVTRELVARGILEDSKEHQTAGDEPGSIPCIHCAEIQQSRLIYARHLDVCAKKPEKKLGSFPTSEGSGQLPQSGEIQGELAHGITAS